MFLILTIGILLQILAWLLSGVRLARGQVGSASSSFSESKTVSMNKTLAKSRIFSVSIDFFRANSLKIRRALLVGGILFIAIYCIYMSDMMLLFGQLLLAPILWYRIGLDSAKNS